MKAAICVATNRPETIPKWLDAWSDEFDGCPIIIVEDGSKKTVVLNQSSGVWHYCWEDIDKDLGENSWIIPRRTSCVKSYGFLKAAELKPDIIITLDDDCFPHGTNPHGTNFVQQHIHQLSSDVVRNAWVSTISGPKPRGYPYERTCRTMPCVISHGLWDGCSDLDAITSLTTDAETVLRETAIPRGMYYPMCDMNLAFRIDMLPAMYQLLMGPEYEYDRFGDIWSGVFSKRICDHLQLGVYSGFPHVRHQSVSSVWDNLRKEVPGMQDNETLWKSVDEIILTKETVADCYVELAEKLNVSGKYWSELKAAMRIWVGLL